MARLPDLEVFAREHGLKIGTIAALIEYRSRNESLIARVAQRTLVTPQGPFECSAFRDRTGRLHLALSTGRWGPGDEVLVRVHEPLSVLDLLDAGTMRAFLAAAQALAALRAAERGVAVLLNCGEAGEHLLAQLDGRQRTATGAQRPDGSAHLRHRSADPARNGRRQMQLLGSPRRMPSMAGYGLEVTGFVAAE